MTEILAGPGQILPKKSSTKEMPDINKANSAMRASNQSSALPNTERKTTSHGFSIGSLNKGARHKDVMRIMGENEALLKRLQDQNSHYNVYEWEVKRKKQVKSIKQICYYPPSLLKISRRSLGARSKKRGGTGDACEPNKQLFDLY